MADNFVVKDGAGATQTKRSLDVGSGIQADLNGTFAGVGDLTAVPAGSTNGTAVGSPPSTATGIRFYLAVGESLTFTIAGTAPTGAPASTFTISQANTGPNWDENLALGRIPYIVGTNGGSPKFRWL